jgi:hypothetical protein
MIGMYCDPPTTILAVQPAQAKPRQGPRVVLKSGAWFQIHSPNVEDTPGIFSAKLRLSDQVQICYGPAQKWSDTTPDGSRMSIIDDLDSGAYMYSLAHPQPLKSK